MREHFIGFVEMLMRKRELNHFLKVQVTPNTSMSGKR